jgi:hypothetical protein
VALMAAPMVLAAVSPALAQSGGIAILEPDFANVQDNVGEINNVMDLIRNQAVESVPIMIGLGLTVAAAKWGFRMLKRATGT